MSRNIGIIIAREFNERVRKKSFIITTILTPLLIIALGAAPTLMMKYNTGDTKKIIVVDETEGHHVSSSLVSDNNVLFQPEYGMDLKDACIRYADKDESFAVLWIGHDILDDPSQVQLINNTSSSVMVEEVISGQLSMILRNIKLHSCGIENIDEIIAGSDVTVSLTTKKNNGSGDEESMEQTSSGFSMVMSFGLGMILYAFILLYGQQVLTSVIEEKQTRVLDVMVTSCSPFDLMMGKILGIALVAAVQVIIWTILIAAASTFMDSVIDIPFAALTDVLEISLWLFMYTIGGFLLYASLYAAAGSSVDSIQDASQFNTIIMLPILLSIIVLTSIFNDPSSKLAVCFSIIPFTSPIIMMARIPFDVPLWQIAVSLVLLYATFVLTTWISARIYRIGIFMHGKKPTWKDLGTWLRTE